MSDAAGAFRLSTLLAWFPLLAVVCAVITTGSPGWGTVFHVGYVISLAWAIVMTISASGRRRCFWAGYLAFTVLYIAGAWRKLEWLGIESREIPTVALVSKGIARIHPRVQKGNSAQATDESRVASRAAHRSVAMLLGCLGGTVCAQVHKRQTKRGAIRSPSE